MPFSVTGPGSSGEGCGGQAVLPLSYWGSEMPGDGSRKATVSGDAFPSVLSLDEMQNRKF